VYTYYDSVTYYTKPKKCRNNQNVDWVDLRTIAILVMLHSTQFHPLDALIDKWQSCGDRQRDTDKADGTLFLRSRWFLSSGGATSVATTTWHWSVCDQNDVWLRRDSLCGAAGAASCQGAHQSLRAACYTHEIRCKSSTQHRFATVTHQAAEERKTFN